MSGNDTITVPSGAYIFTLAGTVEAAAATGDLDVSSFIMVNGAGAFTTIIDPNGLGRGFEVHAGGNLHLNDVTVRNGIAEPQLFSRIGGGILVDPGSTFTLTRGIITNNRAATAGGGVGIAGISGLAATATIIDSTITQNSAFAGFGPGDGGGIAAVGNVTLTVSRTTISSNIAGTSGGGIVLFKDTVVPTTTIVGSAIMGNFSGRTGGGISTGDPTIIANTTISGNSAEREGGALYLFDEQLSKLVNVTIASNTGIGQIFVDNCSGCLAAEVQVQNTIIAYNDALSGNCHIRAFSGPVMITDLGNNLEYPGEICGFDLPSDVHADPRLGPLTNNGGPTLTRAPNPGSPAVDAANDVACGATPVNGIDQRGIARPAGAHCDIGAFELVATTGEDLAIDFGSAGLLALYNGGPYVQLHAVSPERMATGDLDGNGKAELIADFPGYGLWVWANNAGWHQLDVATAAAVATGDLDGNGKTDVIIDFVGYGLWIWLNNGEWFRLHSQSPSRLITGDLDGNGKADVILDFPGSGVWVWANHTSWTQLHTVNPAALAVGDFDGGGRADLLVDFHGFGLWVWQNNTGWFQLHAVDATVMRTGDIDGNGQADAIVSFPGHGIWAWMNRTDWTQLHVSNGAAITAADIDGTGKADVIVSFPGFGIWAWMNNVGWTQLHTQNPEGMTAGNLDGV